MGCPQQGWEYTAPSEQGLTPALAPVPAVKGSQEWGEHARSGVLWDVSDRSLSLHQARRRLEQQADGLQRQDGLLKLYNSGNFNPKFNWQEEDLIDICPQLERALERHQILQSSSPASPTVPPPYLNGILATRLWMLPRGLIICKKSLFAAAGRQCRVRSSGIRLQAALWLDVRRKSHENQSSCT